MGVGWTNTFQGIFMLSIAWFLGLYLPKELHGQELDLCLKPFQQEVWEICCKHQDYKVMEVLGPGPDLAQRFFDICYWVFNVAAFFHENICC